jgi:hypothetical protein
MLAVVGATLSILMMVLTLIALASKYVLLPWLRDQLVNPVQETHKQLTVNNYKSDNLTILDLVHLLGHRLDRVETRVERIERKVDSGIS